MPKTSTVFQSSLPIYSGTRWHLKCCLWQRGNKRSPLSSRRPYRWYLSPNLFLDPGDTTEIITDPEGDMDWCLIKGCHWGCPWCRGCHWDCRWPRVHCRAYTDPGSAIKVVHCVYLWSKYSNAGSCHRQHFFCLFGMILRRGGLLWPRWTFDHNRLQQRLIVPIIWFNFCICLCVLLTNNTHSS